MNKLSLLLIVIAVAGLSACASRTTMPVWESGRTSSASGTSPASGTAVSMPQGATARARVQEQYDHLTGMPSSLKIWLKRSKPYVGLVRAEFAKRGLPVELAYLPYMESGFDVRAKSRSGASGIWQFMHMTGRRFGLKYDRWLDERRDPFKATRAAAEYLTILYNQFRDWHLALAAYNAGEGTISRALKKTGARTFFELAAARDWKGGHVLREETRDYVPRFLAVVMIMRDPARLGLEPINQDARPDVAELVADANTDLTQLAKTCGMSWNQFRAYNPSHLGTSSHPRIQSSVYVPTAKEARARRFLQSGTAVAQAKPARSRTAPVRQVAQSTPKAAPRAVATAPGTASQAPKPIARQTAPAVQRAQASRSVAYTVQRGDTLYSIARSFGLSVPTLAKANTLRTATLHAGQTLQIPVRQTAEVTGPSANYRVRQGDTLYGIARKFNISHADLKKWNGIDGNTIQVGDLLDIYSN